MSATTTVRCDFPGCIRTAQQSRLAGSLEGWIRRDIHDSANKRLSEGMRDFGARHETMFLCPVHANDATRMPSPRTHPDVISFIEQSELDEL